MSKPSQKPYPMIIVPPLMFERMQALAAQGDETAQRALKQAVPWETIPTDEQDEG